MGLFKQIGNWFKGKAMNAEKAIAEANVETNSELAIKAGEQKIVEYRATIRDVMAQNKVVGRNIDEKESEIAKYQRMAERALDNNDEESATRCLESQTRAESELASLKTQFDQNKNVISVARTNLSKMEAKIENARVSRARLLTQRKGAQLRKQMAEANSNLISDANPFADLDMLENQVEREEAQALATEELVNAEAANVAASLEDKYGDSASTSAADKLAALKASRENVGAAATSA